VLVSALKARDRNVRLHAVAALGEMGPQAREAVPALVEALRDVRIRDEVLKALGNIGSETPEAAPAYLESLRIEGLRMLAAEKLERIGRPAVPTLIDALKDEDPDIRETAARILGNLGPQADQAVPALTAALKDPDRGVSVQAAIALGKIGPRAKAAVPALFEALQDPRVHEASMKALERIGFDSKDAIPALIGALKYEALRTYAADRLLSIGSEAVPELIRALEGDYGPIREYAAWILGKIGPNAKAAIPALTDALWDKDKRVRGTAQRALEEIQR
jgi:HEAT repeat protein